MVDDRSEIHAGDTVLLVIEDDARFARVLMDLAHHRGMKVLVAESGSKGLALAQQYRPAAITLDLVLPDVDGWSVFERLKLDTVTAPIPILVISVRDEKFHALELGALAVLVKPVSHGALSTALEKIKAYTQAPLRELLVVEDNPVERQAVIDMLQGPDIHITGVATGRRRSRCSTDSISIAWCST